MWPFATYPEVTAAGLNGNTYDYVVVGGGTAGCVVASRLSEDPNVSVLVLEKGHVKDNFVSRVPLISQNFFMGDPLQVQSTRYSEPISFLKGRRNQIVSAEGIGGSSRINGMLWTRGAPGGYEEWATALGLDEWSWEKVEPHFRRIENAISYPDSPERGHNGLIPLQHKSWPFKWPRYVDRAAKRLGLPVGEDCNNPSAPSMGLFNLDMAIHPNGQRASAYNTYLNRTLALERQKRLTVCTGVVVLSLDVDEQAGIVRGVHFQDESANGESITYVKARREVIVCSGVICTPQILLLSGIGPRSQLDAFDIPVKKELPVGATLKDHFSCVVSVEIPKSETLDLLQTIQGLWHLVLFIFFGKGLMGASSTPKTVFLRTAALDKETMQVNTTEDGFDASNPANLPDTEIMVQAVNSMWRPVPGHSVLTFFTTLVQPKSVGSVELATKDPHTNLRIHHPMFQDPADITTFRKSMRFAMKFAEEFIGSGYSHTASIAFAPGANPELLEAWEKTAPSSTATEGPPPAPGLTFSSGTGELLTPNTEKSENNKTWKTVSDDEIDDYVRRISVGSLHSCCTCPMSRDEKSGVVDQHLRVHGFKNLRIADASVFPKIPSGHTMAPTMMVAERCASFIINDWSDAQ
ncbi:hypothetical protein KVR01_013638 [Diaporthe batatas]|uniref:uncharacterized protein n=1 Tax=Diaporthe batatas TaxID=748121 RepID=UPI001D03D058|nr:uncharacterized protein KVR01_013638 [Diaporthe batatas]KAG8156534.1 hypothetical protein KVR01_013638 [Diaporthe batatas]